jgi:signal peptidase I
MDSPPTINSTPAQMNQPANPPRRGILRRLFGLVRNGLAVIGLIFILYHTCFDLSVISSGSMSPTLRGEGQPGSDWLLSENVSLWFRNPRRWEVVQFVNSDHLLVAKRVVGLPGESISLQDKHVAINGQLAPCPTSLQAQLYLPYGQLRRGQSATCGEGYFVLGDDSKDSQDSRWDGPIPRSQIRSRAWLIVWPPARIGFVDP